MNDNLIRINYEGKWYSVDIEESDHYHLVEIPFPIYKNEIKNGKSIYSFKKQVKSINKNINQFFKTINKILRRISS
jgi:hypothetical protein